MISTAPPAALAFKKTMETAGLQEVSIILAAGSKCLVTGKTAVTLFDLAALHRALRASNSLAQFTIYVSRSESHDVLVGVDLSYVKPNTSRVSLEYAMTEAGLQNVVKINNPTLSHPRCALYGETRNTVNATTLIATLSDATNYVGEFSILVSAAGTPGTVGVAVLYN